jgi:short subunit dehydrogenase-like uncharacterized protein
MNQTQHHAVLFGATSFVGQILTRYMFERHGVNGEFRWAIAGRSSQKLAQLRESLGDGARDLPVIVCDAADEMALRSLCATTRVVVSTVGPYALFGSPLVKVCAETGTDYCDLTGEVQWIKRMIDAHEPAAKKSGARIVHCCGFDSLPSDMGVHVLQQHALKTYGEPCTSVRLGVKKLKGEFSGGTVASLINVVKEISRDPALRKLFTNPYILCPGEGKDGVKQPEVNFIGYNPDANSWLAPFIMAGINTRVVHRSNALLGHAYGKNFTYDEATMTGPGFGGRMRAVAMASGMAGFIIGVALPPTRWVIENYVLPKPGEGPSPEAQLNGCFDSRLYGTTASGQTVKVKVTGDRDPGYGSTGKMLGEAAACLALDVPKTEKVGGFWTPATIFGDRLVNRLTAHAGLTFDVIGK